MTLVFFVDRSALVLAILKTLSMTLGRNVLTHGLLLKMPKL